MDDREALGVGFRRVGILQHDTLQEQARAHASLHVHYRMRARNNGRVAAAHELTHSFFNYCYASAVEVCDVAPASGPIVFPVRVRVGGCCGLCAAYIIVLWVIHADSTYTQARKRTLR